MTLFKSFSRDQRGVSAIEYALLAGLCSLAFATAMTQLESNLSGRMVVVNGTMDLDTLTSGLAGSSGSGSGGSSSSSPGNSQGNGNSSGQGNSNDNGNSGNGNNDNDNDHDNNGNNGNHYGNGNGNNGNHYGNGNGNGYGNGHH